MTAGSARPLRFGRVLAGLALAMVVHAGSSEALLPSPSTCYAVATTATVCSLGSCTTTTYVDDYWCSRTPSTDRVGNPASHNPSDLDQNLFIDDYRDVVRTTDGCAWQFDSGDGLGSNYGGPNTSRPSHNGVDIQANRFDDVSAVGHGKIIDVGWQRPSDHSYGCGYRVLMRHINGDVSVYCHLEPNSATFGIDTWVRAGTVIGQADSSGNSNGHHLHLIYREGGTTPVEYWEKTGNEPSTSNGNGNC